MNRLTSLAAGFQRLGWATCLSSKLQRFWGQNYMRCFITPHSHLLVMSDQCNIKHKNIEMYRFILRSYADNRCCVPVVCRCTCTVCRCPDSVLTTGSNNLTAATVALPDFIGCKFHSKCKIWDILCIQTGKGSIKMYSLPFFMGTFLLLSIVEKKPLPWCSDSQQKSHVTCT